MGLLPRSTWTSTPRPSGLTPLDPVAVKGLAVHWPGTKGTWGPTPALADSAARLEAERAFHVQDKGWSDVAYCLPVSAQALTQRGWLRHDEITSDDVLYTLNLETGLGEWQHPEAVNLFTGPRQMLQDHRGLLSTPNHRWPVWRRRTSRYVLVESSQLTGYHQVPVCARSASQPSEPKYTDDFVELVAWFWTEGHIAKSRGKDSNCAMIYQSHTVNPGYVADISAALTRLYGPQSAQLRIRDAESCPRGHVLAEGNLYRRPNGRAQCRTCWLAQSRNSLPVIDAHPRWSTRQSGRKTTFFLNATIGAELQRIVEPPDKVVRHDFLLSLTKAQLDLFIRVSIQADGSTPTHGGPVLAQKIAERSDAFAFACILAGNAISYGTATTPQGRTMHVVRMLRRRTVAPALHGMEPRQHEGAVWCPTTPNRTWLARDGQHVFFTGNSAAVDLAGRVFDCRGLAWRPASNGNQALNAAYPSVTVLMAPGDTVTAQAVAGLRAVRALVLDRYPHATAVVGHRDLWSTDCPGPGLYEVVRSGTLTSAPLEADVSLDQADLRSIEALLTRTVPGLVWGSTWPAGRDESGTEIRESAQDRLLWASRGTAFAGVLDELRGTLEEVRAHVDAGAVVTLSAQQVADIAAAVSRAQSDPGALAAAVVGALGAAIQRGQPAR